MSVDANLVKKPYTKVIYTPQMIEELKQCMDQITGPSYFIENFVYVQHPTRGRMPFKMYDYQHELCDVYHNYRYSISLVSRQMGKSVSAAAYLLWFAMFNPDSTVLIAAHKYQGAQEIMQRLRYAYESVPDHIRCGVTSYNKGSIEFDNGSRVVAQTTTENTGRGMSISCVYLDEFAFVRPSIAREFWTSLSPTLSTGGKCIITSTPNVDDDQFAELWFGSQKTLDEYGNEQDVGVNGFKGYMATWEVHPDRDQLWADKEREKIGSDRFAREHLCQFVSFSETLISGAKLLQLEHSHPLRKTGQVRWYEPIRDKKIYSITLDPSMGTGGDHSAIQVLELPSLKQVAEWQHNKTRIEDQLKILKQIAQEITQAAPTSEIYWTVENNSLGEAALVAIREQGEETFPGTFMHDPARKRTGIKRKGYNTTNTNKLEACAKLKHLIESDRVSIKSKSLIHELKYFIAKGNTYCASSGETDDLVMSLLVNIRMAQHISQWEEGLENMLDYQFGDDEEYENEPMPVIV
jgi:hypothetical protein